MNLLALGMALFLADIFVRRLVLPEWLIRWLAPARSNQRDQAVLDQLRVTRSAVRQSLAPAGPVAVEQARPSVFTDQAPAEAENALLPDTPKPSADKPVKAEQSPPAGGLADRLRQAKHRARQEMDELGQKDR
jgi:hypothetical protein